MNYFSTPLFPLAAKLFRIKHIKLFLIDNSNTVILRFLGCVMKIY